MDVRSAARARNSSSVQIVLAQLARLGMTKTDFARRMGVSQDYVYRILNNRTPFPRQRETLERIAAVCELEPLVFSEYRVRDEALPISTRLVWDRMRELGMGREDLYQAMGGRISRPYYNSILRGDQPFPTNRAFIQMFALALGLPPTAFPELGAKLPDRWRPEEVEDQEERTYNLFFDKMMADHGFSRQTIELAFLDVAKVHLFFGPKDGWTAEQAAVLARMGELGMGFRELERVCPVPRARLVRLFAGPAVGKQADEDLRQIREALRIARI